MSQDIVIVLYLRHHIPALNYISGHVTEAENETENEANGTNKQEMASTEILPTETEASKQGMHTELHYSKMH